MARIADKHGLTNRYRPYGSKRVVRRVRPRKYLFGAPSRKRKSYKSSSKKYSSKYAKNNFDIGINSNDPVVFIPVFVVFLIMFVIIPLFRCFIPLMIGAILMCIVEGVCKKSWGLPTSRWGMPVSIGWTVLTVFAMFVGFFLALLVQIGEIPSIALIIMALVYAGLSILVLRRRYNKVKNTLSKNDFNQVGAKERSNSSNTLHLEELVDDDSDWEDNYSNDADAKALCSKLKKNLQVDMEFWNEMRLEFKCNLVTSYDSLQLNFEIKNNSGVPWYDGNGGIMIKANFYNEVGNLVHVDDTYVEDEVLSKNRFSDYFFFNRDDISDAVSIEIYAYQED